MGGELKSAFPGLIPVDQNDRVVEASRIKRGGGGAGGGGTTNRMPCGTKLWQNHIYLLMSI